VVEGELLVGLFAGAGSNGGGCVTPAGDLLEQDVGQLGWIGAVPLDDQLWAACVALRHVTGGACIYIGFSRCDAVLLKKLGDTFFDIGALRNRHVASEVFDGVEEALIFDDGDSDCVQIGIKEIGPVGGGGHPDLLDGCGIFGMSTDVLGDGAEVTSGLSSAGEEIGFSRILVEQIVGLVDDPLDVGACGVGQGVVPMQGREIVRGSGLVG
jgi:hypothetical protein